MDTEVAVFGCAADDPLECAEVVSGSFARQVIGEESAEPLAEVFCDFHRENSGFFDKAFESDKTALQVAIARPLVFLDKIGIIVQKVVFESVVGDEGRADGLLVDDYLGFLRFEQG